MSAFDLVAATSLALTPGGGAVMTEGDVLITNQSVTIADIVSLSASVLGREPSLILNRDAAHNINTGTYFVRNSPAGRAIMDRITAIRTEHAGDHKLINWGANGATMIALRDELVKAETVVMPSQLFNAYGEWQPGDFARHFAGLQPKSQYIAEFVRSYPPTTWSGWDSQVIGT